MSCRRIVLLEQSGEIVFEGVSVLGDGEKKRAAEIDDDADACPPTQRSPQSSGFFAVVPRAKGERAA